MDPRDENRTESFHWEKFGELNFYTVFVCVRISGANEIYYQVKPDNGINAKGKTCFVRFCFGNITTVLLSGWRWNGQINSTNNGQFKSGRQWTYISTSKPQIPDELLWIVSPGFLNVYFMTVHTSRKYFPQENGEIMHNKRSIWKCMNDLFDHYRHDF